MAYPFVGPGAGPGSSARAATRASLHDGTLSDKNPYCFVGTSNYFRVDSKESRFFKEPSPELKGSGRRSCAHTTALLEQHLDQFDQQIERLQAARQTLTELADRAKALDPSNCTDPNRCQVIATVRS